MVEYTGHDIYRMMRTDAQGTGSMDEGIAAVRSLSQTLDNSAVYVSALENELAAGWKGGAADAAWDAANPIRQSFADMSEHIAKHDVGLRNQSEQFKGNANSLHDIPANPPQKNFWDHASPFWDTDNEDAINDYNQRDQHNKDKYREYMGATENNTGDLPRLYSNAAGINSNVTIASAASSGGVSGPEVSAFSAGGGSGSAGGGGGAVPGGGGPGAGIPGGGVGSAGDRVRPVGVPGSEPGGSASGYRPGRVPQPTGGASGYPGPAGSSTSAQNWSAVGTGPRSANPLSSGPGVPGGYSSSGGYGSTAGGYGSTGGYGPTGSGFGPVGGSGAVGGGGAAGMGARGGMLGAGPGQGGGAPGGAGGRLGAGSVAETAPGQGGARSAGAAAGGGRGTGMAGAPMGGGGARGADDTEHKTADYLVNEQNAGDIVGDIPATAPPVIGE